MSLIHQALKKLEGGRHRGAAREYSFKKPGIKALRTAILPLLVTLSIVSAYFLFPSASKKNADIKAQPAAGQNAQPAAQAPSMPADLNSQALDEYRSGRFDKAEALFTKAAKSGQASAGVYSNQGLAAMRLGRKKEAEAAFKKALQLDPFLPQALNNYASLLAEAGKTSKAGAMLEKAINADPSYADAHFNLAVLLEKKGDFQGALASYEEFMRLEPSDGSAAQVRKKLMALRSEIIVRQAGGR